VVLSSPKENAKSAKGNRADGRLLDENHFVNAGFLGLQPP
jgi:hypothetical protein